LNKEQFYEAVAAAGGKVLSYFRDHYAHSVPDRRLCVPLTSAYLLRGADSFLMGLARDGFGPATAQRMELDRLATELNRLQAEQASTATALARFEKTYWDVNHGPTHHAVKARELKSLQETANALAGDITALAQQAVALVWKGRAGAPVGSKTAALADLLKAQLTAEGKWSLSLNLPAGEGHALALETRADGRITLFDPDWAFVSLPSVDALCALLSTLLAAQPDLLHGDSILSKVN
jgi:hypothetical protein